MEAKAICPYLITIARGNENGIGIGTEIEEAEGTEMTIACNMTGTTKSILTTNMVGQPEVFQEIMQTYVCPFIFFSLVQV